MSTQLTGLVERHDVIFRGLFHAFQIQNIKGSWTIRGDDMGRVEKGDVVTVEVFRDIMLPIELTENDRVCGFIGKPDGYRIVRVSKGGDPAFQG